MPRPARGLGAYGPDGPRPNAGLRAPLRSEPVSLPTSLGPPFLCVPSLLSTLGLFPLLALGAQSELFSLFVLFLSIYAPLSCLSVRAFLWLTPPLPLFHLFGSFCHFLVVYFHLSLSVPQPLTSTFLPLSLLLFKKICLWGSLSLASSLSLWICHWVSNSHNHCP